MFTRIKAIGIVYALFTLISSVYYTLAVILLTDQVPKLIERSEIKKELQNIGDGEGPLSQNASYNAKQAQLNSLDGDMIGTLQKVFSIFNGIEILCYLNSMFFI